MISFTFGLLLLQIVLISGKSSGAKETKDDKSLDDYGYGHHGHAHGHRHGGKYYRGRYAGKCGYDGFYYRDHHSFVICSNGNAYVQPCAPGTRNSGQKAYQYGKHYAAVPFCDVNLVDYGYNHKHYGSHGYGGHGHKGYGLHGGHGYGYGGGYGKHGGYYGGGYHGHGGYGYHGGYKHGGYHGNHHGRRHKGYHGYY